MLSYTETNRAIQLQVSIGNTQLLPVAVHADLSISAEYNIELEVLSSSDTIDPQQLLTKPVGITLQVTESATPHYLHGIVSSMRSGPKTTQGHRRYKLSLAPWLWLLSHAADCRIFQNASVIDIAETIFKSFGFTDYTTSKLHQTYPKLDYCVQYNETHLNFIKRIFHEAGIFYYFQFEAGKHQLILADSASSYQNIAAAKMSYARGQVNTSRILSWQHQHNYFTPQVATTDYNFESPTTELLAAAKSAILSGNYNSLEAFYYPGNYQQSSQGKQVTTQHLEIYEREYEDIAGSCEHLGFRPGHTFELTEHTTTNEQGKFALTKVQLSLVDNSYYTDTTNINQQVEVVFNCIPAERVARTKINFLQPKIAGTQTATVVGPASDEIYTDNFGRIKVQFHWDRYGKKDEKSSCWIRVAQAWAGNKWGNLFIPRVGQEVVVSFLNGDPNFPLVIGTVYNGDCHPPYDLPANATQSGLKTHSSKDGAATEANEIRFEDKKASEEFYMHAQKDMNVVIENDTTINIKHDRNCTVENDDTLDVKANKTLLVEKDHAETVNSGTKTTTVKSGNYEINVSQADFINNVAMGKYSLEAMNSIELKVGQHSLVIDQSGISLNSPMSIKQTVGSNSHKLDMTGISADGMMVKLNGTMVQVNANAMLELKGGITMIN